MPLTSTLSPSPPTSFLLTLYPAHQLLDSAGPLDILSTISKQPQGSSFTLTIAAETLDPIDLSLTSRSSRSWDWEDSTEMVRGENGGFAGVGFNHRTVPDVTFQGALESLQKSGKIIVDGEERDVDVVLIPGGIGSRLVRVDRGSGDKTGNVESLVEFLRGLNKGDWVRSAWMTVCTGSDILARTGLLDGRRATTNVRAFEKVKGKNPGVEWLEKRRWVRSLPGEVDEKEGGKDVIKREVWTSAGVSAGMDLMLWFTAEVWERDFAEKIAGIIEYEWREGVAEGERDPFYE